MKRLPLVFVAAFAITASVSASQTTAVPAFFVIDQKTDPSKATDWVRIQNAGSAVSIVVALGGEGGLQTLTGDALIAAQDQFNANRASPANQLVLGYVDSGTDGTGTLTMSTSEVLHHNGIGGPDGDGLYSVDGYQSAYPTQIDGIYFDRGPYYQPGGSTQASFQSFYTTLYQAVHPAKVMVGASQFPDEWMVSGNDPQSSRGADYLIVWENTWANYKDSTKFAAITPPYGYLSTCGSPPTPCPPAWWSSSSYEGRIVHVVVGATQRNVDDIVSLSRSTGYGSTAAPPLLYVFDTDTTTGVGYSGLSCSFEQQIAAISDQTAVEGLTWCGSTHVGDANGSCVDINSDVDNCGACGDECTTFPTNGHATCSDGACGFGCNTGYCVSTNQCVSDQTDTNNCGACGNACSAPANGAATCSGGACGFTCNSGYYVCGSSCCNEYLLTVTKSGTGSGTVTSSPTGVDCGGTCSASFASGTRITLTATPDVGSHVVIFSGSCRSHGTEVCTFTLSAAASVNVEFYYGDDQQCCGGDPYECWC